MNLKLIQIQLNGKVRYRNYNFLQMINAKMLFGVGLLIGGAFSNSLYTADHGKNHENCDEDGLAELIDILDNVNPLCARWDQDKCLQCAARTYFNQKGICTQIDPLCKNFDQKKRRCTMCYPGYQLNQGKCIIAEANEQQNWALSNPLCANWNSNRKCTKCSAKSYFNSQGICVMVSPDCRTFSQANGYCLSCYDGFQLQSNGKCIKANQDTWRIKNPLCSQWSSNGLCNKCASRSYKNKQGICQQIDPSCNTFSTQSGECLSCYGGFSLRSGKCVEELSNKQASNPHCARWDKSRCLKCSDRTYFNKNGICVPVSPQCKTYSQQNGNCKSCYPGYDLAQGECLVLQQTKLSASNPLCANWSGKKCIKCSPRSYLNSQGICANVDPNCNTYSEKNGDCTSCYPGYDIQNGKCVVAKATVNNLSQNPSNPLCSQWTNKKCVKCSPRSYFSENGICIEVDPNCQKFSEQKKFCQKCYSGYKLTKDLKGCVLPGQTKSSGNENIQPKGYDDPLCSQWLNPSVCKTCSPGTYKNNEQKCIAYDSNCKQFDRQAKVCQQCYDGYVPIQQNCLKFTTKIDSLDDRKCVKWSNGQCLECARGLVKNVEQICVCEQ